MAQPEEVFPSSSGRSQQLAAQQDDFFPKALSAQRKGFVGNLRYEEATACVAL
jgi:hypothetical protein